HQPSSGHASLWRGSRNRQRQTARLLSRRLLWPHCDLSYRDVLGGAVAGVRREQDFSPVLDRWLPLLHWHAVMGGNYLPSSPGFHPHICQPVVILVRLSVGVASLVIRASYHGGVPVHANLELGHFRHFHMNGRLGAMAYVASLAVRAAILNGDDEIISQECRENLDLSLLV